MLAAHCTQARAAYRHAKADYENKVEGEGDRPRAFAFAFFPTATRMGSKSEIRQANTVTAYRMTCFRY